jgi:hypothetical protein
MVKFVVGAILTFALAVILSATFLVSAGAMPIEAWKDIVGACIAGGLVGSVVCGLLMAVIYDS